MKKSSIHALIIAGLTSLLFSGCMTGVVIMHPLEPLAEETKAARIPVYISPEVARRSDSARLVESHHYQSGAVFAEVFTGRDANGPTLEILSANSQDHITDMGFTGEFVYRISASLHIGAETHPLKGEGLVRAHGMKFPTTYAQLACERACVDVANQAKAFLK